MSRVVPLGRYITVEITSEEKDNDKSLVLKPSAFNNAVQKSVEKLYGDYGVASIKAGLNAQYCNPHTRIALTKCRHGPHDFIINAIPTINDVGGRFVSMKIVYIGATMKHCFLFIRANIVLDTLVCAFSQYCKDKFTIEKIHVYPSPSKSKRALIQYPTLTYRNVQINSSDTIDYIGVKCFPEEVARLLSKMGLQTTVKKGKILNV